MITRRGLVGGLLALVATPAIIRTPGLLMPVRPVPWMLTLAEWAKLQEPILKPWMKELIDHYTNTMIYGHSELEYNFDGVKPLIRCLPPTEWRLVNAHDEQSDLE